MQNALNNYIKNSKNIFLKIILICFFCFIEDAKCILSLIPTNIIKNLQRIFAYFYKIILICMNDELMIDFKL